MKSHLLQTHSQATMDKMATAKKKSKNKTRFKPTQVNFHEVNQKQNNTLLVNHNSLFAVNNHSCIIELQHAKQPSSSFKCRLTSALSQRRRPTPEQLLSGPVVMTNAKGHLRPRAVPGSGSGRALFSIFVFLHFLISEGGVLSCCGAPVGKKRKRHVGQT